MFVTLDDIRTLIKQNPSLKRGCIVDTNVIFAAMFPLDAHNDWAESTLEELRRLEIPIYSNINIRSEFIDLNRRVLIPEGLMDFYYYYGSELPESVSLGLKSLQTRKKKAAEENRTFKLSDVEIKRYRKLLDQYKHNSGVNGWTAFCEEYFRPYIKPVWSEAVQRLHLNFVGTRAIESKEHFESDPTWEEMTDIVGRSGIGSSDAMIVNLFIKSKFSLIVTADSDVKETTLSLASPNKLVLAAS